MTENPYDVLGISPDASPDEVKKAYRKKARENHPDLNPDDPGAAERMNRVNEAYDRIMNPEKYAKEDARRAAREGAGTGAAGYGAPFGYGSPFGYGAPYGGAQASGTGQNPYAGAGYGYEWVEVNWEDIFGNAWGHTSRIHPEADAADNAEIRQAVFHINSANFRAALGILNAIPSSERNARWHYLAALANDGAGNTALALEQIRRALQMDPGNADYARAQRSFQQGAAAYEQEAASRGFSIGFCDPTWLCFCACCGPTLCQPLILCL